MTQVPIISAENEERVQLGTLREDIQMVCEFCALHCLFYSAPFKEIYFSLLIMQVWLFCVAFIFGG